MLFIYLIFLSCTPILAIIGIIGICINSKSWRKYIFVLSLVIFMVAYSYQPHGSSDLTRYLEYISESKGLTLFQVNQLFDDSLYIKNFFFWLAALINNPHLIPAITTTIVYGVTWYITCDSAEIKGNITSLPIVLLLQTMCLQFVTIINNVRNVSAFSLVVLAAYLELVKKRRSILIYILYVIPIFIHPSALVLVIFRVVLILPQIVMILLVVVMILFPMLLNFVYSSGLTRFFGSFLSENIDKLWSYLNDPLTSTYSSYVSNSRAFMFQRYSMMGLAIVLLVAYIYVRKNKVGKDLYLFESFSALINVMTLACWPIVTPMYWRFSTAAVASSGTILSRIWANKGTGALVIKILLSFIALLLVIIHYLINRYYVSLGEWISDILVNDFYVVIVKFIAGVLGFNI